MDERPKPKHEPRPEADGIDWAALDRLETLADQTESQEELEALLERMGYTRIE